MAEQRVQRGLAAILPADVSATAGSREDEIERGYICGKDVNVAARF